MSKEKRELRRSIKKETKELTKENRWNLVLGELLISAGSETCVLAGPFQLGLVNFSLKTVRGEEKNTGDLFSGFSNRFGKSVGLFFLQLLYLCLWTMLFYIPGIIKSYSYAMSYYILQDNPEIGVKEAITKSRQMMKGHKWELFVMQLSFIGWILLSIITCRIVAFFFVAPWMNLAYAKFYDSIKDK